MKNPVNKLSRSYQVGGNHYSKMKVQPWDAMESCMSDEEFVGYLRGNIIKYVMRCSEKDGIQDLKKSKHYLEKLIDTLEINN